MLTMSDGFKEAAVVDAAWLERGRGEDCLANAGAGPGAGAGGAWAKAGTMKIGGGGWSR